MNTSGSLADHWHDLTSAAVLGCDRRPVPDPPVGIVAALAADRAAGGDGAGSADDPGPGDPAVGVLDRVALLAAVRRAGLRPAPAVAAPAPCPSDPRPVCPPAAAARLAHLMAEWPHLLDEWLARVAAGGWRLPPETAVMLLAGARTEPDRHAVVSALAGPLAAWIVDQFPTELGLRRAGGPRDAPAPADVPVPDDVARLAGLTPVELARSLAGALGRGEVGNHLRAPLVRMVSALSLDHLAALAPELSRAATHPRTMGLALTLADLAQTRLDLIRELM